MRVLRGRKISSMGQRESAPLPGCGARETCLKRFDKTDKTLSPKPYKSLGRVL